MRPNRARWVRAYRIRPLASGARGNKSHVEVKKKMDSSQRELYLLIMVRLYMGFIPDGAGMAFIERMRARYVSGTARLDKMARKLVGSR